MGQQEVLKAESLSPELPWNQRKLEEIGPTVMKFMEDHEPFYKRWAETWFNNFQFIYGNQAVRWSKRYGYAIDTDFLSRQPAMNQRAQTNIARVVAEALASMIYANLPEWEVEASDESSVKGKRFKRIVQKILDAYMVRLCMDREFANAAMIYTVFGQFGAMIDWNPTGGRQLDIPKWKKAKTPIFTDYMANSQITGGGILTPTQELGPDGKPLFQERWEPVLDQLGKQLIDKVFAGDVRFDVLTPFEYRRAIASQGMHKTKYVERILLLDYDEYLDRYAGIGGKTKYWARVQPIYSNPAVYRLAVRHFMRMQFTTPPGVNDLYSRAENVYSSTLFKNKVLVVEHYDAPHPQKWPLGRRLVICNGDATHITVPPYSTGKMDGWHPFIEAQWLNIPPNSLAAGPMNDVIQKNRELNVADSLIATALRRNMGSQLLIRTGAGIDPQRFTGEPGMVHEVPDVNGLRWLHDDMPMPGVLPPLRQSYKDDVYETSGAGEALRGERSPGAPSGYAQKIIEEREERRLSPPRKNFEQAIASGGEKIFYCLKSNIVKLDDDVMGYLTRAASGDFQPDDVIAMLSSQVNMGVEINIEADSMHLRSKATQQATMNDMASQNSAVQNRLQTDPGVLDEFLDYFGAEKLRDKSSAHRDRAQRENEQFSDLMRLGPQAMAGGTPTPIYDDDDQIHLDEHTDFEIRNTDEMRRNPEFYKMFTAHKERHRLQLQEKQQQLMPGTSLQVPAMMAQTAQQPTPTIQTIFQNTQQQQQLAQQQAAQGIPPMPKGMTPPPKGGPAPQAPRQPTAMGAPKGKMVNPQAPSGNTPPANRGQ